MSDRASAMAGVALLAAGLLLVVGGCAGVCLPRPGRRLRTLDVVLLVAGLRAGPAVGGPGGAAVTLDPSDQRIVEAIAARAHAEGAHIEPLVAIHVKQIAANKRRLRDLDATRASILRAIAMREPAIAALRAPAHVPGGTAAPPSPRTFAADGPATVGDVGARPEGPAASRGGEVPAEPPAPVHNESRDRG